MHSPGDTTTDGPRHSHAQVGMEGVTALIRPVFSLLDPVYWIPPPPLQLLPIATMLLCVFIAARQGTVRREGPRMDRWAWTVREAGRLRDSPSASWILHPSSRRFWCLAACTQRHSGTPTDWPSLSWYFSHPQFRPTKQAGFHFTSYTLELSHDFFPPHGC
jgi:hypothetical protein